MMRKPITRKCEWLCTNIGGNINISTYFESLKILILRIEVGGHLALECLWILDRLDVFSEAGA